MPAHRAPRYRWCWLCSAALYGNGAFYTTRVIDGGTRYLHKACAEGHDQGEDIQPDDRLPDDNKSVPDMFKEK